MKIFIRAASCISPQETFNHRIFIDEPKIYKNNILNVIEPDYKNIIDAKQIRRMSKVVRIGVATALSCLKEADIKNVDAIVTGTAYGCMEDSEDFLKKIIMQDEQMLSPTAFIQSTHNTVGAQIALILKCHQYNNTFVHKGFSFENVLLDAMLLFHEEQARLILAGSDDEMTGFTFSVLQRLRLYKTSPLSNLELYKSSSRGSIAGEGAAFFLLSKIQSENDYATLDAVETFYKINDAEEIKNKIENFVAAQNTRLSEIDLIIEGRNGDAANDKVYEALHESIFKKIPFINYKHLCGEYPTSSSFAMWLAANIIKEKKLPKHFEDEKMKESKFRKILIYNNYQNKYHSVILLTSCG